MTVCMNEKDVLEEQVEGSGAYVCGSNKLKFSHLSPIWKIQLLNDVSVCIMVFQRSSTSRICVYISY